MQIQNPERIRDRLIIRIGALQGEVVFLEDLLFYIDPEAPILDERKQELKEQKKIMVIIGGRQEFLTECPRPDDIIQYPNGAEGVIKFIKGADIL